RPLTLAELTNAQARRELPSGAVCLTFDDGYSGVAEDALPVLERHELPATVFVAAGFVGSQREFWWDELEPLLEEAPPGGGRWRRPRPGERYYRTVKALQA